MAVVNLSVVLYVLRACSLARAVIAMLFFIAANNVASAYAEPAHAKPMQVRITGNINPAVQGPEIFFEKLLNIALEKTRSTDGDFVVLHTTHGGGIARDRAMVIAGAGIDVMWGSVTKERERQMRLVPVDLLKGLNNYRVLLINKDAQSKFSRVKSLDDLREFVVGTGEHWTDGEIFKNNGFTVSATSSYGGLFKMLAARRFNFISRGLYEINNDSREYKALGLAPEQSLLIKYDVPMRYSFFVNKNNGVLGDRLERGLKMAIEDGSFDRLFYDYPAFKAGMELLKDSQRTVITLRNTSIE
jgi:hypothetical protein